MCHKWQLYPYPLYPFWKHHEFTRTCVQPYAHCNGLVLLSCLAIPKSKSHLNKFEFCLLTQLFLADKEHQNDADFCKFHWQLLHSSLAKILKALKPFMTQPEVVHCTDGHFRRVIYELGLYLTNYLEQALLACIVESWCTRWANNLLVIWIHTHLSICSICITPSNNLDSNWHIHCSCHHTDMLDNELELGMLWDNYGIVSDVIVSNIIFPTHTHNMCQRFPPVSGESCRIPVWGLLHI